MSKNPFVNAVAASAYIALVGSFMYYGPKESGPMHSVLAPIAMISLFTLSAAVMGYLFVYNPLTMYIDGNKKEALHFFLKTLLSFAIITAVIFIFIFLHSMTQGLTALQVENSAYDVSQGAFFYPNYKAVKLVNGIFTDTAQQVFSNGFVQNAQHSIFIPQVNGKFLIALGDLNADGLGDAAAIVHADYDEQGILNNHVSTSTGSTVMLEVLLDKNGTSTVAAFAYPENGIHKNIQGVAIRDGIIDLSFGTATDHYKFADGVLTRYLGR